MNKTFITMNDIEIFTYDMTQVVGTQVTLNIEYDPISNEVCTNAASKRRKRAVATPGNLDQALLLNILSADVV